MQQIMDTLNELNGWSVCFRLMLAAIFGGCIGAERGRHGRPAGLRTYILVSVGACITTLTGLYGVKTLGLGGDPLRIGAQVVSGIGFLGVGTIISDRNANITGLTTAAGLWTSACIGLATGIGFYWGAIVAFLMMLIAIVILSRLENAQKSARNTTQYYLEIKDVRQVNLVHQILKELGSLQVTQAKSGLPGHVGCILSIESRKAGEDPLAVLQSMECVIVAIPITL